jgi:hypothetical protein
MKSLFPLIAFALLTMTTQQAKAVELLVRVNDTVYATTNARNAILGAQAQLGQTYVATYQRSGQQQAMYLLAAAASYEAGALNAAIACRQLAESIIKTDPRDPEYGDLLDRFDDVRAYAYQHSQTALSLVNAAQSTVRGYGISFNLIPAIQQARAAADSAVRLNTFYIDDGGGVTSPYGIVPLML